MKTWHCKQTGCETTFATFSELRKHQWSAHGKRLYKNVGQNLDGVRPQNQPQRKPGRPRKQAEPLPIEPHNGSGLNGSGGVTIVEAIAVLKAKRAGFLEGYDSAINVLMGLRGGK